jgi:hypothetical protein
MRDDFDSPLDVTAEVPATALSGLAQMASAVGVATLLLLMFNAKAIAAWADGLDPGPRTERVNAVARCLADQTAARGFDGPRAALVRIWERMKAAGWPRSQEDQRKKV